MRRAYSALGAGWRYQLGGKPLPSVPAGARDVASDCTGFLWWAAGRRSVARLDTPQFGEKLAAPAVGAAVWHDAAPPANYGHAGLVVKVYANGDYATLDCSSSAPDKRGGAIRYLPSAAKFWNRYGNATWRFPAGVKPGGGAASSAAILAAVAVAGFAIWTTGRRKFT